MQRLCYYCVSITVPHARDAPRRVRRSRKAFSCRTGPRHTQPRPCWRCWRGATERWPRRASAPSWNGLRQGGFSCGTNPLTGSVASGMHTFAAPLLLLGARCVFFASQKARVCACGCNECFALRVCSDRVFTSKIGFCGSVFFFVPLREGRFVDTTRDGGERLSPENTCCKRLVRVHTVKHARRFRPGPVFEA